MTLEDAFCARCDDVRPVGENGCVSCWALRPPVYADEQRAAIVEQVRAQEQTKQAARSCRTRLLARIRELEAKRVDLLKRLSCVHVGGSRFCHRAGRHLEDCPLHGLSDDDLKHVGHGGML